MAILIMVVQSRWGQGEEIESNLEDFFRVQREYIQLPGLEEEYRFLLFADLHLTLVGEEDSQEMREYATERSGMFNRDGVTSYRRLAYLMELANQLEVDGVLLAGDILDNPSQRNVDFLIQQLYILNMPYAMAVGNHDFTVPWEYFTEKAMEEFRPRLNPLTIGNPNYPVMRMEEFTILTIDNSRYRVESREYVEILKELQEEGNPIIIQMHVPFIKAGNDELLERSKAYWPSETGRSRVLIGYNGKNVDELTREFKEIAFGEDSLVIAFLAGHAHFHSRDMLNDRVVQIITPAAVHYGDVIELVIRGER